MLDIKSIKENPAQFDQGMKNRGNLIRAGELIIIHDQKNLLTNEIQNLQSQRNALAKEIALLKRNNHDATEILEQSKKINQQLEDLENKLNDLLGKDRDLLTNKLLEIPNLPDPQVPVGKSEEDNQIIETHGQIRQFDFAVQSHFEIGEKLKMLDFEQSILMSGSRFSTLNSSLARLERALSNFMLDEASKAGYMEISPPNLVKSPAMMKSGQLPKFAEEAFETTNGYWLIPTAEVPLVNLVAGKILSPEQLPLRYSAYTPCFRSEAGAAGKDTRGMFRQHQFKKVELVSITTPEQSQEEHERMTNIACQILKSLKLPYRKMLLCTADIGFCAQKTYDLEVWLPGQNKYREISSCSNCGDFQARRLEARYKNKIDGKNYLLHTLNGSSLAVGRTIIAILENYQNADGSVTIPEVLISYMGGLSKIS